MLREIGITLFLACVGISAGDGFVDTIVNNGGFAWLGYGFIITTLALLIIGCVGRYFYKINIFTLMGLIAGSTTDPPGLAYSNAKAGNDAPSVGYATVYPLTMFLRVLTAQLLILFFARCGSYNGAVLHVYRHCLTRISTLAYASVGVRRCRYTCWMELTPGKIKSIDVLNLSVYKVMLFVTLPFLLALS